MFDLKPLADNFSSQVIILLVILGLVALITAVATQGAARGIATVFLIIILIALVLILKDAEAVGEWLKNKVFKPNEVPNPPAALIFPMKGRFL